MCTSVLYSMSIIFWVYMITKGKYVSNNNWNILPYEKYIAMKNIPYLMFYFLFDFMLGSCHIIYYKILHGLQQHGLVTHIPARQKKQQKTTHFPISICREYLNPYLETSGTSTSNCLGLKMWFPIRNDYFIMALLWVK